MVGVLSENVFQNLPLENSFLAAVTIPTDMGIDAIATDAFTALTPVVAGALIVGFGILGVVIIVRMIKGGGKKIGKAAS